MDSSLKQVTPNTPIGFTTSVVVPKGWGREIQIVNNINYAGKLLIYDKSGATSSMHFHLEKSESFYVLSGEFSLNYYDLEKATLLNKIVKNGDVIDIPAGNPHQLVCVQPGTIIEFSTTDYDFDNYRIGKGDSQR
jgi:quercetin dioxygenase-like cupin family protein